MKRLVVCCDGTWNAADSAGAETNVFRLATAIDTTSRASDRTQIVMYIRGVGTTGLRIGDFIEGAFGLGIDENIRAAYMFLAQNYEPGDDIFLFGFSRGAFTVRSLVGFIHKAGLLERRDLDQIHAAWAFYRLKPDDPKRPPAPAAVQPAVEITFVGVWDTVGALGIPGSAFISVDAEQFGFHDTDVCPIVRHGCQALAIDEHRDAFVPTLWTGDCPPDTRIDQTWFAGAHSDVGGGYHTRELADIPLVWMARHAEQDGLRLDWSAFKSLSEPMNPLAATHESRTLGFIADRLRPTWREVCERSFSVAAYERLYAPMDRNQNPLRTINEKIHASVAVRFNRQALQCVDDVAGTTTQAIYAPQNIDIFADARRVLKPDTPIDDFAWPPPPPVPPAPTPASQATA